MTASSSSGDVPALTIRRHSPAVLVRNQAAFPDTARLLPVMVPALARASRSAGLLGSSSSVPWRTTAYTVPTEAE